MTEASQSEEHYIRDTSLEAYIDHLESGKAELQKNKILLFLMRAHKPATNREIAHQVEIEPSTVSARRNELLDENLIKEAGKRKDKHTGIRAYTWRITLEGLNHLEAVFNG